MLSNIRGILNRRNDPSKSPEGLSTRTPSEDNGETNASSIPDSVEGFLCPTCLQAFPSVEALQNHYETIHSEVTGDGRDMFNCSVCKMKLGSEIELNSHYTRHHASNKEGFEIESMVLQVKALEEGKALLQEELRLVRAELSTENARIREERDSFKLKSTKLTDNLAELKLQFDELKAIKNSLETSLQSSEERRRKLEAEIQKRPEADDVNVLQKELVSVQTLMNDLTLRREAEKETLQKQCNSIQETCLKLQAEKTDLENQVKSLPQKEEILSLQEKISKMSVTISGMEKELKEKETEKSKLIANLEKCANYQEIKSMLSEKNSALEDIQRQSSEKDTLIAKLRNELETSQKNVEEMKKGRENLFSKIEEGEGANAAMLQLKEENARLQEQFLQQQKIHSETANDTEAKIQDLRDSLKKANTALELANEERNDLCKKLETSKEQFQTLLNEKEKMSQEFNNQIQTLQSTEIAYKSKVKELNEELVNKMKILEETSLSLEKIKEEMKNTKMSYEKRTEQLELEKQNFEKKLAELGKTLPVIQADLLQKEKKLKETEVILQESAVKLKAAETALTDKEAELNQIKKSYEGVKSELESTLKNLEEFEATKIEFCDKISSLNEEKLQIQMRESDLKTNIEEIQKELSEVNEKCVLFEEENKSLRASVTNFQNEKNSMLSDIDEYKKAIIDLSEVKQAHALKILEMSEDVSSQRAQADRVRKEAALEKELFLKEKVKLQKQLESLENDCARQLSQIQGTVTSLESQLEEAEEKNISLKSSLDNLEKLLKEKDIECEKKEAHHTAQVGVLTENIKTLREDLTSEQKRRETLEQKLDEICGAKLELDAKLENALDERKSLLERCLKSETECERLQTITTDLRRKYDDSVAALQELGRENQTLQMECAKLSDRKWINDADVTHCALCGKIFTVTNRKHHCRKCGNIFCHECSAKTATVAASKNQVRVCDNCYNEVAK